MSRLTKMIRDYIKNPKEGASEYGKWALLNQEQRRLILKLCDEAESYERLLDEIMLKKTFGCSLPFPIAGLKDMKNMYNDNSNNYHKYSKEPTQGENANGDANSDAVNHPKHYTDGKIECIDYIEDKLTEDEFKGYIKGNVIKYLTRERLKNGTEDLRKAKWYLDRLCESIEKEGKDEK